RRAGPRWLPPAQQWQAGSRFAAPPGVRLAEARWLSKPSSELPTLGAWSSGRGTGCGYRRSCRRLTSPPKQTTCGQKVIEGALRRLLAAYAPSSFVLQCFGRSLAAQNVYRNEWTQAKRLLEVTPQKLMNLLLQAVRRPAAKGTPGGLQREDELAARLLFI